MKKKTHTQKSVVNQFYDAEIIKEYVIRGNTAVLKCSIPSFVADFVYVESWIDEEGTVYTASGTDSNYGALSNMIILMIIMIELYLSNDIIILVFSHIFINW